MLMEEIDQILQEEEGPLEIIIDPLMTVEELKLKTFENYCFPIEFQRWLINDEYLNDDNNTLHDCGITNDSIHCLNLYINTQSQQHQPIEVNFKLSKSFETESKIKTSGTEIDYEIITNSINTDDDLLNEAAALPLPHIMKKEWQEITDDENSTWKCNSCTLINVPLALACSVCGLEKPLSEEEESNISVELKKFLNDKSRNFNQSDNLIEEYLLNEAAALPFPQIKNEIQEIIDDENSTWKCSGCTLINLPLSLVCLVCGQEKPLSVKEKSTTSEELKKFLKDENGNFNQLEIDNIIEQITKQTAEYDINSSLSGTKPTNLPICHYLEILNFDTNEICHNTQTFDCPICYINVEIDEGCVLRDCLHTFCRDCLVSTIMYSEDAEVKCPYADSDYSCDSFLQDREIRKIVTQEIYEKHLAKSVRFAEHQIKNSYHCKTPNCPGWCICEETVNQFECPVCELMNCLICQVIHNGKSCYEYQDELKRNGEIMLETEQTNDMLNQIVHTGQGMNCPTCQVVIMKISGCDWLQCSMCKTEMCWVTRKPRRGPNGCQCGVNGIKCHPNCQNCH